MESDREEWPLGFLIDHICFPCKLVNGGDNRKESSLVRFMTHVLSFSQTLDVELFKSPAYNEIKKMFDKWAEYEGNLGYNEEDIYKTINDLKTDQSASFYLEGQNACLILSKKNNDSFIMSAFQASASNKQIMSEQSDVAGIYPAFSFHVENKDILLSKSFSTQLTALAKNKTSCPTTKKAGVDNLEARDVVKPDWFFEWIPSILVAHHSNVKVDNCHQVVKKIRDDIIGGLPFRRSGLWFSIKVVLQLQLCELFGEQHGKVVYKALMALVINKICEECLGIDSSVLISSDIKLQIIKKLARRLYKLDLLSKDPCLTPVFELCAKTIEKVRSKLDERFNALVKGARSETAKLDLKQIDSNDKKHNRLEKLIDHINELLKNTSINQESSLVPDPKSSFRNDSCDCSFPELSYLNSSDDAATVALYDIEQWIEKKDLNAFEKSEHVNSLKLIVLMESYSSKAASFYAEDELGYSRMVITCMKTVCLLDVLAVKEFPMLEEYKLGFNCEPLESLLMPQNSDLVYVNRLKQYIQARNEKARLNSLVDYCEVINENTFGVKYAKSNAEMQKLIQKIVNEAEYKKLLKLQEIRNAKREYDREMSEIREMTCDQYMNRFGFYSHDNWDCVKCDKKSRAQGMRVEIHEWPLPENTCLRNAVAFELQIPASICYLRDALHLLRTKIFGFRNNTNPPFYGNWIKYDQISSHALKIQRHVTLGSTTVSFVKSRYSEQHPTDEESTFFKPNGYSVTYCELDKIYSYDKIFKYKDSCTLKAEKPYDVLQETLAGTSHTENSVLAAQSTCPIEMTTKEFVKYGCLRAGHRLQMRNLLDAIETRALSFKHRAVFSLVAQTLWQVGPQDVNSLPYEKFTYPECHIDFHNRDYFIKLHEILSEWLRLSSKCWNDHMILLNIVTIAARGINLAANRKLRDKMIKLMLDCRAVLQEWIKSVSNIVSEAKNSNKNDVKLLEQKFFEICCFHTLTFYADEKYIELLLNSPDDVIQWLTSMNYINDNKIEMNTDVFIVNLHRRVLKCMLQNEEQIYKIINENNPDLLTSFLTTIWPDATQGTIDKWIQYRTPNQKWYHAEFIRKSDNKTIKLQLSIQGEFLVLGLPVGKLPQSIYSNPDFKEFFGTTNFDVVLSCEGTAVYVTKNNNKGYTGSFTFYERCNNLIIKERKAAVEESLAENPKRTRKETNKEFIYLKKSLFCEFLPKKLIDSHSHWLDIANNVIEFRVDAYSDYVNNNQSVYFTLDLNTCLLYDRTMDQYLVDIQSKTFKEIHTKITKRLELDTFVHIKMNKNDKLTIELPRMSLLFEVDTNKNYVFSRDYRGMIVSYDQQIDTLIGLEKGLLLCEPKTDEECLEKSKRRQFIVPNGIFQISKNGDHQTVSIDDISSMKTPSYYSYEIDFYLKTLRAEESISAWLYLAWLHAATSHVLPDPFLGISGTEMSLQLLQSGNCWSPKPLEPEAAQILVHIAKLSPKRQYSPPYLKSAQIIKWPVIHSMAAHEAFQWICVKLINDSESLSFAYEQSSKKNIENESLSLSQRAYHRNKHYYCISELLNPNFESIMGSEESPGVVFDTQFAWNSANIVNTRKIIAKQFSIEFDLQQFLFQSSACLQGVNTTNDIHAMAMMEWEQDLIPQLRDNWLNVYNYFRSSGKDEINKTLMLSFLAYRNVELEKLLFLQTISKYKTLFRDINPPNYAKFVTGDGYEFDEKPIKGFIKSACISLSRFSDKHSQRFLESDSKFSERMKSLYQSNINEHLSKVRQFWNTHKASKSFDLDLDYISDRTGLAKQIDEMFQSWANNFELVAFIEKVVNTQRRLITASNLSIDDIKTMSSIHSVYFMNIKTKVFHEFNLSEDIKTSKCIISGLDDLQHAKVSNGCSKNPEFPFKDTSTDCTIKSFYLNSLEESWNIYHAKNTSIDFNPDEIRKHCLASFRSYLKESDRLWNFMATKMRPAKSVTKALIEADIWPRIVPRNILKWFIHKGSEDNLKFKEYFLKIFKDICVLWSMQQQMHRCLLFLKGGDSMKLQLIRELFENKPYENWTPEEYPEWLALIIEQNFMIRKVQVDVAKKMMNPPNNENTVMQLNMGEGKTSVIIPLLVTALADGKNIVRVIVLKPLFNMNYSALAQKLGGIINRRVYVFPCQRDIDFTVNMVETYEKIYEECQLNKGVILSLPEHQLSFKLKGLELARSEESSKLGSSFLKMQQWINDKSRDILDESDELLSVKYQLVYPVGSNSILDGGDLRWLVAQTVLSLARKHFDKLQQDFGDASVEYHKHAEFPQAYPIFRLLNENSYPTLCKNICLDILKGNAKEIRFREQRSDNIDHLSNYLLEPTVDKRSRKIVCELYPNEISYERTILHILRGYFTYKVLYVVLIKRWKVEYGVNPKRQDIQQAVPYRAKDVPAERAQFAHPDIFILLTQLSYYYSGLDNKQLDQIFDRLAKSNDCVFKYKNWIDTLSDQCVVHDSVKEYFGINLHDLKQKYEILYPLLKYHTKVIDYWLCEFLYPKEGKQFSEKLETSAWDLCETKNNPVSGFSGTNDSRLLLPSTANYHEIPELKSTNGMLLHYLLLPENNTYNHLQANSKGKDILKVISSGSQSLRLLLDIGALMLELSNEQVIHEWLSLRTDVEAGIYFDNNNNLMVVDRKKRKCLLELSSFKKQIDKCVIFLDEAHTRGTDIKFPYDTIGAVTLGRGITKDRLMQGCMRLRMLGQGHAVRFYASYEVHQNIIQNNGNKKIISSKDVLTWVLHNTRQQTADGFLYWASQGLSLFRRASIYDEFLKDQSQMKSYAEKTTKKDLIDLHTLYDCNRLEDTVYNVISEKVKFTGKDFTNITGSFHENCEKITEKLKTYVNKEKTLVHDLEEEQELELEIEIEQEKVLERPQAAKPCENILERDVQNLVVDGVFKETSTSFLRICKSFDKSTLKPLTECEAWNDRLFVTRDFTRTIEGIDNDDYFLRPPRWLCVHGRGDNMRIVVLSDYEANTLFADFGKETSLAMLLPRLRKEQERIIAFSSVTIAQNLLEELAVFAGSLYFNADVEQDSFISFIGYSPSPRDETQQQHFENGRINQKGFIEVEHRITVLNNELCKFKRDPEEFIRKLFEIRNYGIVPQSAHHLQILCSGKKVMF